MSTKRLHAVVAALLVALGPASPAHATAGDGQHDPIELTSTLPTTVAIDTTAAMADASDPPADQGACYEEPWGATTFYSFTAPVDTLVEMHTPQGSVASVNANVYTRGVDGSLVWYDGTGCQYIRGPVVMAAGQRYIIMVGSFRPGALGTLTLRQVSPKLEIHLTATSTRVHPRIGSVMLGGTLTCNTAAQFSISGWLHQTRAGTQHPVIGEVFTQGACEGAGTIRWTAIVAPEGGGRFRPGRAQLDVTADARGEYLAGDLTSINGTVFLKPTGRCS